MRKISSARRSRRAAPLKDSDYDHEINLVDHAKTATPKPISPEPPQLEHAENAGELVSPHSTTEVEHPLSKYTTAVETTSPIIHVETPTLQRPRSSSRSIASRRSSNSASSSTSSRKSKRPTKGSSVRPSSRGRSVIPKVTVNEPTPLIGPQCTTPNRTPRRRAAPETAIDILYENQRGGFLCGLPLFSPRALGQLDPPPWTNLVHKPSPTDINTAQVPDPSWVWVWPEWHINRDAGLDDDGWEYSFMFAKRFSWHPPKWYNSFVRRRAWTRKRTKRDIDPDDPHMLNTDYFTVHNSTATSRSGSKASSRMSRGSMSTGLSGAASEQADIQDMATLMAILNGSRIDREKIEAVENFLEHGEEELEQLQHNMHEIMAIFVFQASRRALLSKLNGVFEQAQKELKENNTERLQRRCDNLKEAIRHADEECRRLEYWSDIKKLVKEGESKTATDKCKGWNDGWQGVDNSGPAHPGTKK